MGGFLAVFVFVFSWLFRFNDPNGSFAGMTDDHFFYVVRGWQILFGDVPVRDFVDHGAPLYYYVAATVQWVGGRGTFSEIAFSVTMLALGAALTFCIAARASGSLIAGLGGAAVQVLLEPRFYNYPKILAYAVGLALLWRFVDAPSRGRLFAFAAATAVAFLLRHDHGVFLAASTVALVLLVGAFSWRDRLRHLVVYGAFVAALLAPYAVFVQMNGGVVSYWQQAQDWAERDRLREPVVWPGLFDFPNGRSEATTSAEGVGRTVAVVRDNAIAWMFYAELALPFAALLVLPLLQHGARPDWPHAGPKIAAVAVLGIALNAGFLRSPLGPRLADPSVPHAILLAWLAATAVRATLRRELVRAPFRRAQPAVASLLLALTAAFVVVFGVGLTRGIHDRLDSSSMLEGAWTSVRKAAYMAGVYRTYWPLERWAPEDASGPVQLARYLRACTAPTDRVLLQHYMPQVHALADRAFAGGHADLRPGFFKTEEAQRLTIARLEGQSVPLILLETGDALANFHESFPLISAYLEREYEPAGEREIDDRYAVHLLAHRDRVPTGRYPPFDWPCYFR